MYHANWVMAQHLSMHHKYTPQQIATELDWSIDDVTLALTMTGPAEVMKLPKPPDPAKYDDIDLNVIDPVKPPKLPGG